MFKNTLDCHGFGVPLGHHGLVFLLIVVLSMFLLIVGLLVFLFVFMIVCLFLLSWSCVPFGYLVLVFFSSLCSSVMFNCHGSKVFSTPLGLCGVLFFLLVRVLCFATFLVTFIFYST